MHILSPGLNRLKTGRILFSLTLILVILTGVIIGLHRADSVDASSTALTFTPVADSYVNQSSPTTNYGANASLRVDASPLVRSFLRFNVQGLPAGTITKATLSVYANSASSVGFSARKISDNNWQESQLTYNNAPALGTLLATSTGYSANTWVNVDVTPAIQGNGVISLALATGTSTATNLAARESGANAPKLIIEVSAAAAPTIAASATNPVAPVSTTPTVSNTATSTPATTALPSADFQPAFPIRAAFYYPWFPEAWNQAGFNPFTNYTPTLGYYDSGAVSVIQNHIKAMSYGNIDAGILSWWGQGSKSDGRVNTILNATASSSNPNFRWGLYYENESQGDPSQSQIQNDLTYIKINYAKSPAFLKVNGKFVVFVYANTNDSCGMADRWVNANKALGNPAYVVLKVFTGYKTCASQPDSWHQYSPAVATDQQAGYSYAIAPGFWLKGQPVRLARDINRWISNVKSMVASGEKWQLVTTFNEWGEGTSVESASQWVSASGYGEYLDALHANGGSSVPQPTPTNPPAATPAPTTAATPAPTATQPPSSAPDPIIYFTGDLVSSSSVARAQKVVSLIDSLMAKHAGTQMLVASTGDNEQENNPTLSNYQDYFGTTYGKYVKQGIFMQIRGNHDIQSVGSYTDYDGTTHATGAAYWDYFGANSRAANINGKKLTDFSFDFGGWHIIGLDQLNGSVDKNSLSFLQADLAKNSGKTCQLVYWHVPTYSSGGTHGDSLGLKPINQVEYDAGVDIQINGHDHHYQRFYPINPSGVRDDARGITTFIDGIGGQDGRTGSQISVAQAASAKFMDVFPGGEAIGVIQFVLHPTSADYTLYNANDGGVLDQGTVVCH